MAWLLRCGGRGESDGDDRLGQVAKESGETWPEDKYDQASKVMPQPQNYPAETPEGVTPAPHGTHWGRYHQHLQPQRCWSHKTDNSGSDNAGEGIKQVSSKGSDTHSVSFHVKFMKGT